MADGDNKVYVLDDGANKHEGMTKSEIMDTIVEMMETGQVTGGIYIDAVKEQNAGESLKFWVGTQAQYEALPEIDPYIDYKITDANTLQEIDAALTQLKKQLTSGAFKVKSAYTADDVKTSINGKAISEIFESDGKTAKKATIATADENGNNIMASYALKDDLQDAEGDIDALEGRMTTAEGDIYALEAEQQTNAKLSQVVRIDAAQQFTDDQKWRFSKNSRFILKKEIERAPKWKTVACISNYGQVCMAVSTDLPGSGHLIAKFFLAIGYGSAANITQIGYTANSPISAIRLRSATNAKTYVDLLFNEITAIETTVSVYFEANLTNAYESTDIQLFDFVVFSGDESDYTITTLNLCNSGINTTGTIYQQGEPVFATDPSKLVPSTANGWTETTVTGSLPSAGVYMVTAVFNNVSSAEVIGTTLLFFDGTEARCIIPRSEFVRMTYHPNSPNFKWDAYTSTGAASIDAILYKRIA